MMYSTSTATLLFSGVLFALLHNTHCLSVGQRCDILAEVDECDPGLTCTGVVSDAYCESSERELCDLATCPSVWCGPSMQYTPEDECCPICPPQPTLLDVPSGCRENGITYNDKETWKRDDCTTCTCINGFTLCSAVSCLPLSCSNPVHLPDQCCPVCLEVSRECNIEGKIYQNGEHWMPNVAKPCQRAYCSEGQALIYSHQCAAVECKNPVYFEDTCCPICPVYFEDKAVPPPAPGCTLDNGATLSDGDSSCPAPNVTAVCNSGVLEYKAHCEPITCANLIRGQDPCDCPFCGDGAQHFEIAALLDMSLPVYARQAQRVDDMIKELTIDAGFIPEYNSFSNCNRKICVKMHLMTPDMTITMEDVVQVVRDEVNSKEHGGELQIGYVGDFRARKRSVRSASDTAPSGQHNSVSFTIIAVTVSALGVVASVVSITLLASFIHRKHTLITV